MAKADTPAGEGKSVRRRTPARKREERTTAAVEAEAPTPSVPPAATYAPRLQPASPASAAPVESADVRPRTASWSLGAGSVRSSEITHFLRQLIMLIEAGTPLLRALKGLASRGDRPALRGLIADIAAYVEVGNPLWQAFDRHPRYFDTVFVNLVRASEASGTLVPVLKRIVQHREESQLLRKRVRSALIYPVILVIACFAVLLLLVNFVVPEFEQLFRQAGIELPPLTRNFMAAANWFRVWWWLPILVVIGVVVLYRFWVGRSPIARLRADRIKLRVPVFGPILHKAAIVEMTQTMALLLRSGLSMMATLDLTRNAIRNRAVAECLQTVRDSVEQGQGMEAPLRAAAPVIPAVVTDMFVTGEESGRLDVICEQIATEYEEEVKIAVATLSETLQPVLTVAIGLVVLFLFVSLFLPIVTMVEQISSSGLS